MDALLAAITLWLSTNIQPSSNLDYLRIEFAPSPKIVALRYRQHTHPRKKKICQSSLLKIDSAGILGHIRSNLDGR
jgi:hypothetical protein